MRKTVIILTMLAASSVAAQAQRVTAERLAFEKSGDNILVDVRLGLEDLSVGSNRAVFITPVISAPADSLLLSTAGVYGRSRWWYYMRNGVLSENPSELQYRAADRPDTLTLREVAPYEKWMRRARLRVLVQEYGCASCLTDQYWLDLGRTDFHDPWKVIPDFLCPPPSEKVDTVKGSANVEFVVDRWDIDPSYRETNAREYGKIIRSLDTLRAIRGAHVMEVSFKGYASPESPYKHNEMLAQNRTHVIRSYVQGMYNFDAETQFKEDYLTEDWPGLRKWVETSDLPHRREILAAIDGTRFPRRPGEHPLDAKERYIATTWPDEYERMKEEIYPALRHTEYSIVYRIDRFMDAAECLEMVYESPRSLDLEEFWKASTVAGSEEEVCRVFDVAVRMFPDDPLAHLNAAQADLMRGDVAAAADHLAKAGDTPEADYVRATSLAVEGRYTDALAAWQALAARTDLSDTLRAKVEASLQQLTDYID